MGIIMILNNWESLNNLESFKILLLTMLNV